MAKQDEFQKEELSSKTLELMLFREMITSQDFLSRLSGVIDFRWFRTPHIRLMAEFAMLFYRKYGGVLTRDLVESLIQKRNDAQVIEANKVDMNTALYDFNKARDMKKKEEAPAAPTTKKCPFCQTEIDIKATRCPHCTSELK